MRIGLVKDLDEGSVDMSSLLEQGLVAPVRVQPTQFPCHAIVLPAVIFLTVIIIINITIIIREAIN